MFDKMAYGFTYGFLAGMCTIIVLLAIMEWVGVI